MTKTNLGRICFVPRGTYSASESYKRLDVVSSPDNGISYVAIADSTGAALTDETKWQVMVDNSAAIRQLKDDVAAITPDDTVVDGKPWTSKKTVDSLCMPLEATGNPVQVYPVEGYPLGVKVSWEPTQAGEGDPSPDNVRPITGRNTVSVTRCGRNLVKHKYAPGYTETINGVTFTVNGDYSVTVNGTATRDVYYNLETIKKGEFINKYINAIGKTVVYNGYEIRDVYVQPVPAEHYPRLFIVVNSGEVVDTTYYPTIVYGTTATPYEPYTGSTTDIALPETVYGGEVDAVSNDGQETWKIIDLANAKLSLYGINQHGIANFSLNTEFNNIYTTTGTTDYFTSSLPKDTATFNNATKIGILKANETTFYIRLKETDAKNEAMAKAYLASINATLVYKLAEPVPFTATGAQLIPALSGTNTIYTDADSVVVTGAENPKHTIVELKNAIISLGGNI